MKYLTKEWVELREQAFIPLWIRMNERANEVSKKKFEQLYLKIPEYNPDSVPDLCRSLRMLRMLKRLQ